MINHGHSGYATIVGYVLQEGRRTGEADKRIHLDKNEQVSVSFELDVKEEVGYANYGFEYKSVDSDHRGR